MDSLAIIRRAVQEHTLTALDTLARTGAYCMYHYQPVPFQYSVPDDPSKPVSADVIQLVATDADWPTVTAHFRGEVYPLPELSGPLHHHRRLLLKAGM